jgi:hypothetical protein
VVEVLDVVVKPLFPDSNPISGCREKSRYSRLRLLVSSCNMVNCWPTVGLTYADVAAAFGVVE